MNAPVGRYDDPNHVEAYAPRWLREHHRDNEQEDGPPDVYSEAPELAPGFSEAASPDQAHRQMREHWQRRHELEPDVLPLPPMRARSQFGIGQALRIFVLAAVAIVLAYLLIEGAPRFDFAETYYKVKAALLDAAPVAAVKSERLAPPSAKLVVRNIQGSTDVWMPLDATLQGAVRNAFVLITGLRAGTQISTGQHVGLNGWRLSAGELANARFRVPQAAAGSADLTFELRLADDTVLDRQVARLEMAGEGAATETRGTNVASLAPVDVPAAAPSKPAEPDPAAARKLDQEELVQLLKRGQEFLQNGDLAAARLMLLRAAQARNAPAALALASTYDPLVLQQLGVYGAAPDINLARLWYERAREYGAKEAAGRLEQLARGVQ